MRNYFLLPVFFLFTIFTYAQTFNISGTLVDEIQGSPLESATVFAEKASDSTLITYTISDKKGFFELKGDTGLKSLRVNISYTGYAPFSKEISLNETRNVDLGTIKMALAAEALDGVLVKASRAPITIKKDTLEFNAASFKTKKDATVEDLLKELPGVEVDAAGAITVNGKAVNKILVNGKAFFGDDPTIATKNLTKEMIDKIQVSDTKTDAEAFTGEEGDDQNKTINITIDKEKNKGIFGRVAAGAGTDERFEYAGLINYFDNDTRISALGGGNNINSPGFSFGEIQKMFGGASYVSRNSNGNFNFGGRNFGGGEGITNSRTAGANYVDDFGKTEFSSDYFYSAANSFNEEIRNRENILPDNRYFSNVRSNRVNNSDNHSFNLKIKREVDSTFQIDIRPQFNYSVGDSRFSNNEETRNTDGELTNQSTTDNSADRENVEFRNDLSISKKYGDKGAYVRLSLENNNSKNINDEYLVSNTDIFGVDPQNISRNQFTDGEQTVDNYQLATTWQIPLIGKEFNLDLKYEYETENRKDKQSVFDFDSGTQDYSNFNTVQSTDFTNKNRSSKPEVGLDFRNDDISVGFSAGYVFRTLESEESLRDINFENRYDALELDGYFRYSFSKKSSMYTGYSLSNEAPNVTQLSPYVNVSDPLNIRQGNPDLDPSNRHNFYGGFNNYDYQTKSGIYSYAGFNATNNAIVPNTTIDENFVRNTTYTNVDGVYNFYVGGGINKTKKIDSLRSLRYNFGLRANGNRNVNFNNGVQYASRTNTYSPEIGLRFIWEELFEIRPSYELSYSKNTFNTDNFNDNTYLVHEIGLQTITTFPKKLEWNNDIKYTYNADVAPGFQKDALFWNSSLAYSVLKNKGLVTIKVYDLLDQNTNARRIATNDYIQDVQSTVLQQYFMLGFSYKFNTLGAKGETRENEWGF